MLELVSIALAGAAGSVLRYILSFVINDNNKSKFPAGTFAVNVIGCFFIGLFSALSKRYGLNKELHHALTTGFCGGFTTFSTLSNDALGLLENRHIWIFFVYVIGTIALGIVFVMLGKLLGECNDGKDLNTMMTIE